MTKESPYEGPIFKKYLLNQEFLNSQQGQSVINEHMLFGWLANKKEAQKLELYSTAKSEFKRQWHLNQTYAQVVEDLAPGFLNLGIKPTLLKGIILIGDIYQDFGDRSMSDIDILIKPEELEATVALLGSHGFKVKGDIKWRANEHKVELLKKCNNIETVIELHTRLFYHGPEPEWSTVEFHINPYKKLAPEELILYLSTHIGFQHSFLKLFWMIDIHLLLSKAHHLNEKKVISLAKKHKVYNSLSLSLYILNQYFETPMSSAFKEVISQLPTIKKLCLNEEFLINPKKNLINYLVVKHLCKDGIAESLRYDVGWLKDRFFS